MTLNLQKNAADMQGTGKSQQEGKGLFITIAA